MMAVLELYRIQNWRIYTTIYDVISYIKSCFRTLSNSKLKNKDFIYYKNTSKIPFTMQNYKNIHNFANFSVKCLQKPFFFCNFASILKDIHNKDYSVVKTSKVACGLSGVHVAFFIQLCWRSFLSFSPSVNWRCTSTCLSRYLDMTFGAYNQRIWGVWVRNPLNKRYCWYSVGGISGLSQLIYKVS